MVNIIFKACSNYSGRLNAGENHKIKWFELFFFSQTTFCNKRGVALLIPGEQSVFLSTSVPCSSCCSEHPKSWSQIIQCPLNLYPALNGTRSSNKGECPGQAAAPVVLREGHKAQGKANYCWTEMTE